MTPIQIILVVFFLFAIAKVIGRFRQDELSKTATIFWVAFWLAAGLVVILPDTTFYFARLVGVARGADLVVYSGLALLFFVAFRLMVKQGRMERNLTKLTREMALYNQDKDRTV